MAADQHPSHLKRAPLGTGTVGVGLLPLPVFGERTLNAQRPDATKKTHWSIPFASVRTGDLAMQSLRTRILRNATLIGVASLLTACGDATDAEQLGTSQQALAPGSNAQVVSNTIPTTMAPGERLNVQVVMRNTGSVLDGSNTWSTSGYSLYRLNNLWSWVSAAVPVATPVNNNATFNFVVVAPSTPGTYTFAARMRQDLFFGDSLSVPNITVSNATTPRWSCTYVPGSSTVPSTLAPGEVRTIAVTVQNSGSATWASPGTYLRSQDAPTGFWNQTVAQVTSPVAPGGTFTFNFAIKAPATTGTYSFKRQLANAEVGDFRAAGCIDTNITVGGVNPLNATLVSQDFPTVMAPGESRFVSLVLQNSGTEAWTTDGAYRLGSKNTPASLWGTTLRDVVTPTAPNSNHTFAFTITAPTTPGSYRHRWRMRKLGGADQGDFGVLVDLPVTVDANAPVQYSSQVVTQGIPLRVTAGKPTTFTVAMRNNGAVAWTGSSYTLFSTNSPTSLWGLTASAPLGAAETIASGAQRTFVLNVVPPATPGTYVSSWRLRQLNGVNFFGETATTTGIEVTLCGNGVVDAGEQCDDSNLADGDACSATCQTETTRVVDLSTDQSDRTIVGLQTNKALANVAIGDVSGDNVPDVVVGANDNMISPIRNQAGVLRGFSGASFYGSGAQYLTVYGASPNDSLGAIGNGVLIGDVTGDGQPDLVASAGGADGPLEARSNSGSVYVLAGGATLTGVVDLGAAMPHVALRSEIYGPAASSALQLLALGDVTGDGISDVIAGTAGSVFVIPGGATLTGTIDLATPPAGIITVTGNGIGGTAAVGDFGGSTAGDLLVGSPNHTHNTLSEAGGAWGVFGPITSNKNVVLEVGNAAGPSVAFLGAGVNSHLGRGIAVGDVLGSARADVILGATQQRKGGLQVGAVNVWAGGMASGTTFNLGSGDTANLTVLGEDQYDDLGSGVATGDWNNDGIQDLALAAYGGDAPGNVGDGRGDLAIILGSRALSGTIDLSSYSPALRVYGAADRDLLGSFDNNLAFGDIDSNGSADLCVGSRKGGTGGALTAPGRVDCFR
jgi:cysteine-rich repeat protein